MPSVSVSSSPDWDQENLTSHHEKRVRKNRNCTKIYPPDSPDPPVDEDEYRNLSRKAVKEAWVRGKFYCPEKKEDRCFFADDDLVLAITDKSGRTFITCYHVHTDSSLFRPDCEMSMERTKGDRRNEFDRWIEDQKKDEKWTNVEKYKREE